VLIQVAVKSKALILHPLRCRGFDFRWWHGCLFLLSVLLSGTGLCVGLITCPEESNCVCVCVCVFLIRGKSPIMGRFPNLGRCIISYQEVLRSVLKNVNH
jgi:hypothetical protein